MNLGMFIMMGVFILLERVIFMVGLNFTIRGLAKQLTIKATDDTLEFED